MERENHLRELALAIARSQWLRRVDVQPGSKDARRPQHLIKHILVYKPPEIPPRQCSGANKKIVADRAQQSVALDSYSNVYMVHK
jgi:hypothetical protein